jgi:hypothetical protein
MNVCERTFSAIASHPPQQKAIAHFSKTNPIALLITHSTIASLLPQEKRSPTFAKLMRSPSQQRDRISPISNKSKRSSILQKKCDLPHKEWPQSNYRSTPSTPEKTIAASSQTNAIAFVGIVLKLSFLKSTQLATTIEFIGVHEIKKQRKAA